MGTLFYTDIVRTMLKSPNFFRKKVVPAVIVPPYQEALALVDTLCRHAGDKGIIHDQVKAQAHTVLRCALSIITRDLVVLWKKINEICLQACTLLPAIPVSITQHLLTECRERARSGAAPVSEAAPECDSDAAAMLLILESCAAILVAQERLVDRHVMLGFAINEQLVRLKQKHDWGTLLPPDTPGYLFPDVQNVHLASIYSTLPAPDAPGM